MDWNIKNSDGDTPVMYCLKNNKIETTRCLINTYGVDLHTVERDGQTLSCRDKEGWSLVFRAIQKNKLGEKMSKCLV